MISPGSLVSLDPQTQYSVGLWLAPSRDARRSSWVRNLLSSDVVLVVSMEGPCDQGWSLVLVGNELLWIDNDWHLSGSLVELDA